MDLLDIVAGLAVFAGAALQSAVGFGFSLACGPLVFAAFGPQQAVGLLTVVGGLEVNLLALLAEGRRPQPLVRLATVALTFSVPGTVAGVVVLRSVDAVVLQALLTATVLVSLVLRRRADDTVRPPPRWGAPAAGLAGGVLTTTTTTAGPALVLLLVGRGLSPVRVRDTLAVSFVGFSAIGALALAATGTTAAIPRADTLGALAVLALAGQLVGRPLFARLHPDRHDTVLTAVLVASALVGLAVALG